MVRVHLGITAIKIAALTAVVSSGLVMVSQGPTAVSQEDDDNQIEIDYGFMPDECPYTIQYLTPDTSSSTSGATQLSGINDIIVISYVGEITSAKSYILSDSSGAESIDFLTKLNKPAGSDGYRAPWITNMHQNGTYELITIVEGSTDQVCRLSAEFNINNVNQFEPGIVSQPDINSFEAPLNGAVIPVNLASVYLSGSNSTVGHNLYKYTRVNWETTLGTLQSTATGVELVPNKPGEGTLIMNTVYGGFRDKTEIPFTIYESQAAEAPTFPVSNPVVEPFVDEERSLQSRFTIDGNPLPEQVEDCIVEKVGQDVYDRLNAGERPRFSEYKLFARCLALVDDIVPATIAPVDPIAIEQVKVADEELLATQSIVNKTIPSDSGEQLAIELSGVAEPNSDVLIYVFSDPLVLSTVADSNGNWSYILSNPLEPGEHEVYAVVESGDGIVQRSNALSFIVGTAEASADNPSGASLELTSSITPSLSSDDQDSRNRNVFIFAAAAVIIAGALTLLGGIWIMSRMKNRASGLDDRFTE